MRFGMIPIGLLPIRTIVTAVSLTGFLWVRRQRNKLKQQLAAAKEDLRLANAEFSHCQTRAVHAEELNRRFLDKVPSPTETP